MKHFAAKPLRINIVDWGFLAVNAVCSTLKSTESLWDQLPHNYLCALYKHRFVLPPLFLQIVYIFGHVTISWESYNKYMKCTWQKLQQFLSLNLESKWFFTSKKSYPGKYIVIQKFGDSQIF